ncbi:hypothetical protein I3J27_26930 [Bradyrhizobium xenonodulans]|uniref:Uncharacterized protein n=1 Tax=Bradyrhizobium xenonodulans TaxID=2736875 RepID=A0ABY7MIB4_9BRAD|nr:hypothetical protein [Bradyrhizobium xenonodulans]WBL76645.1 hypothetical protein I3J27_26930 [Bradyrhizobium xenonodulans]
MNVPAFLIAAALGAAFLGVEYQWYYQPDMFNSDVVLSAFSSEHAKARAAVRHALIDPDSAKFSALRSVEADAARYVCGAVKARDKSAQFVDAAFVYTVAIDFARVDDDGRITNQRSGFRSCPAEIDKVAQQKPASSPGVLSIAKTVQKLQADTSAASVLTTLAPSAGGQSSGGTMEQQIRELAAKTGPSDSANGGQSGPTVARGDGKESERRADQPPVAWPTFPPDHPLGKSTRKRTPSEALAMAKDVAERWERAKSSGDVTMRPSSDEIKEACRALLTIDPKDSEYQKAWAAFSQLRKMDSDIAMK